MCEIILLISGSLSWKQAREQQRFLFSFLGEAHCPENVFMDSSVLVTVYVIAKDTYKTLILIYY